MLKKVSVNTLTYNNQIVGYRLSVVEGDLGDTKYYDISVDVADKYKIARGMSGVEMPLIPSGGLLITLHEKENGLTVEDISNNVVLLKELSALRNKAHSMKDIKLRNEEDRKIASKVSNYERLLRVCLNMISGKPYFKKINKNISVISVNLDKVIDTVLISQGVFTTTIDYNNRLKESVTEYLVGKGFLHIVVADYKKGDCTEKRVTDSIVSECTTSDLFVREDK